MGENIVAPSRRLVKVAVIGAAGYAGGELLRLLLGHPAIVEWTATSRSQAGKPIADSHPALAALTDARFAGLTPGDALVSATRNGALLIGVDSIGVVAPGKVADLVILTRDPTADIHNTTAIERVMSRGRLYTPDSIPGIR